MRIEGFRRVFEVLNALEPYIRFKRKQAELLLELIPMLQQKLLSKEDIVSWIKKMRGYNYFSSQRNTLVESPVTTYMEGTG